jgi:PAS domain S-box-containing protein
MSVMLNILAETLAGYARAVSRERLIRDASAALAKAPNRERIYAAALEAVLPFIEEAPGTRVSVWAGSEEKDRCVAAAGDRAEDIRGRETYVGNFPDWVRIPLLEGQTVELRPGQPSEFREAFGFQTKVGAIFMVPLMVRDRFEGRIVVASESELRGDIRYVIETLASQVALALERVYLDEELYRRRSEQHFRALIQSSSDVIFLVGDAGVVRFVSPSVERVLGYRPEDLVGVSGWDMAHPEEVQELGRLYEEILDDPDTVATIEARIRHSDGSWRSVEVVSSNLLDDPDVGGIVFNMRDITERKRAEQALRESEEKYRTLVEQIPAAIYIQGMAGPHSNMANLTMYASPQIEEQTGYASQAFEEDPALWIKLLHPEDRERVLAEDARTDETGEPFKMEYRQITRDGSVVWVRDEAVLVRDEEGNPAYWQGVSFDITDRKNAEEEVRKLNEELEGRVRERTAQLEESQERYRLVLQASNDGIFDRNINTEEMYWNDRLFEIFGLSSSKVTPSFDLLLELMHPEDRPRVMEALAAHLEHDEEYAMEYRARHPSGEYRTCFVRGKAVRDEEGKPVRMAGVVRDITDRKKSEASQRLLAEAGVVFASSLDYREQLPALAQLTVPILADWCAVHVVEGNSLNPVAVANQNPEKIQWANELLDRYPLGLDSPHALTTAIRTGEPKIIPEVPDELLRPFAQDEEHLRLTRDVGVTSVMVVPLVARGMALGTITLISAESKRRYGEGDLGLAEELARRMALAVDNARLYEGAQRELSERKRAEEEVRKLNEELEGRVRERTAQLEAAVAELKEAREAAEAANRAKSEFLANMSHEIRTPMNGVIGMTGLLLDTGLSEEQRDYAETIRTSGEHLLDIINDILDFSKIEAGKLEFETIDFDLRATVEETAVLLAERAHRKGLELICLVESGVPTALRGDPGRIRQVLTNLLGNAIKFTEKGEVVVKVQLVEENGTGAKIRFSVADAGIGMTEDQRSRLFQAFSQADASTTRRYGGTGLGLSISSRLVGMMDGEMEVESESGVGSIFYFTLPMRKQPEKARAASTSAVDLGGLKVLLVDDNATNRRILHEHVTSWGMKDMAVGGGPEALEALRSDETYDVAILDMQMPDMDGLDLARRIKADPSISGTRLIMLTSVGERGDAQEVRTAGIGAYLLKPVRRSDLHDAIAVVVGGSRADREEETPLVTRHSLHEDRAAARARLLVAEDNPVNQKVAVKMLARLGYRADVAGNGLEAVEALSSIPYHAVLMDVQMPEMDGYAATAEIRRSEGERGARRTPIIAMTAGAMRGDREAALEAGMDDYVSKPVKPEELEDVLDRWLSQESQEGDPIDRYVLDSLRELQGEGEPDLVAEIAGLFLEDAPTRMRDLRKTFGDGDARGVERAAHAIKGSAGNMGATNMANICQELEEAGASGDLSNAATLLDRLESEFERVRAVLEAEVRG